MATPNAFASASLYVGDLNPDVTEANLFENFSPIGAVASIRVCRDAITRRSLGYAYVNFLAVPDAERAIEQLNNQPIKGRPCRIMWSQRDPSLRKSGKGNIFIKNLDKEIDHKALFDTFSQFGPILSCKIELDDKNESKGYGYIQYQTNEAADKAIEKVNGKMLNGKKVFVGTFIPRKERIAQNGAKSFTNIFVKNLDESVSEEQLKEMFSSAGQIQSAAIMRDEEGKSKGFGFINYAEPEEAQKAVDEFNEKEVEGKPLFVGRAQKKSEREAELRAKFEQLKMDHLSKYQGVNLYIKNLDDEVDDDKLRGIFAPFGLITSSKVMRDSKGTHKGFGFVCFSNPEEATKAVTELNGKIVGSKPLYVALAQRKEMRRAQLEAQFAQRPKVPRLPTQPVYGGQPMYYPGQGQPGYVYPQMMAGGRGGRFPPSGGFQPNMPNYVMVQGRGGKPTSARGGGVVPGQRRGMKQPGGPTPAPTPIVPGVSSAELGALSPAEQKRVMGEKLYPLIAKTQPNLAGKITGMILDSSYLEEMLHLIENPEALTYKINEAITVLKNHEQQSKSEPEGGATAE